MNLKKDSESQEFPRVAQIFRKPFPGAHSIEGLFSDLQPFIEKHGYNIAKCVAPYFSKGFISRYKIHKWAGNIAGGIFHVTGDIHFAVNSKNASKTLLTIHDLTMLHRSRGLRQLILKHFWFTLPCRRARIISVISEFTKQDLLKRVALDPTKIEIIPDIVGTDFVRSFLPEERPLSLLQVGTTPNKNLDRLFKAIAGMDCELRILGKISDLQIKLLAELGIRFKNYVGLSRAEVIQLYNESTMVSLVSTNEGFGLPIIEAQSVGRPVITSNLSSMPEVAGNAACFVDPFNIEDMRRGFQRLINDLQYRRELVQLGFENVKRFSPEVVAEKYANVYSKLAEFNKPSASRAKVN